MVGITSLGALTTREFVLSSEMATTRDAAANAALLPLSPLREERPLLPLLRLLLLPPPKRARIISAIPELLEPRLLDDLLDPDELLSNNPLITSASCFASA